jgi:hypothetical protein
VRRRGIQRLLSKQRLSLLSRLAKSDFHGDRGFVPYAERANACFDSSTNGRQLGPIDRPRSGAATDFGRRHW